MITGYTMKNDMSKTVRFILFISFVLTFLISAPLLVLYTAGYRLDLTHGRIVHTAVLNISSYPKNATISVDDSTFRDRTPAVINTILPGEHSVSLQRTGYIPWNSLFSFESKEAQVIGPIALFLNASLEQTASKKASSISTYTYADTVAYIVEEETWLEGWLEHIPSGDEKLFVRLPNEAVDTYELRWSPLGGYLLLLSTDGTEKTIHLTRVEDGSTIDIPSTIDVVEDAWWDAYQEPVLYARTGDTIIQWDILKNEQVQYDQQLTSVSSYQDQTVILSESNNKTVVSFQVGETASIITYLPLGDYTFVPAPDNLVALYNERQKKLVLLDVENREQPILLTEEAVLWQWDDSGNRLLYSSGFDLKQYTRSTHESNTLTRLSSEITQLWWYPHGQTAIFQTDGTIKALHLEDNLILSETVLGENAPGLFWIDKEGYALYLFHQEDELMWTWSARTLQEN